MKLYVLSAMSLDGGNGYIETPGVFRTREEAIERMAKVVASVLRVDLVEKGGSEWLWKLIDNEGVYRYFTLYRSVDGHYVDVADEDSWSMRLQVDEVELEEP